MTRICGKIKKKEPLVALPKPEGLTLFLADVFTSWLFIECLFPFTRQQNVSLLELHLILVTHRLYYKNICCDIKSENR